MPSHPPRFRRMRTTAIPGHAPKLLSIARLPGLSAPRKLTSHVHPFIRDEFSRGLVELAPVAADAAANDVVEGVVPAPIEGDLVVPGAIHDGQLGAAVEACSRHGRQHLCGDHAWNMKLPRLDVEGGCDTLQPPSGAHHLARSTFGTRLTTARSRSNDALSLHVSLIVNGALDLDDSLLVLDHRIARFACLARCSLGLWLTQFPWCSPMQRFARDPRYSRNGWLTHVLRCSPSVLVRSSTSVLYIDVARSDLPVLSSSTGSLICSGALAVSGSLSLFGTRVRTWFALTTRCSHWHRLTRDQLLSDWYVWNDEPRTVTFDVM